MFGWLVGMVLAQEGPKQRAWHTAGTQYLFGALTMSGDVMLGVASKP